MSTFIIRAKKALRNYSELFFIFAVIIYVFSMFIYPFVTIEGDLRMKWTHVQFVWDRWQSLNVGFIALVSSVIALKITTYKDSEQRKRNFLSAKAFLPEALNELIEYFQFSAKIYIQLWEAEEDEIHKLPALENHQPKGYKNIFSDCIRYAEPDVAEYLSRILSKLQVHNARLAYYWSYPFYRLDRNKFTLLDNMYRLGELQSLTAKLFDFGRGIADFDKKDITIEDLNNAYMNLDILVEEYAIDAGSSLDSYMKTRLANKVEWN